LQFGSTFQKRSESKAHFHPLVWHEHLVERFVVSLQFAQWFGRWSTPAENQFNFLAYAFLHGKIVSNQLPYTGGLTLYTRALVCSVTTFSSDFS